MTVRVRLVAVLVLLLGAASAVGVLLGQDRAAAVGLVLLATLGVLVLLRTHLAQRSRLAHLARSTARLTSSQESLARRVRELGRDRDQQLAALEEANAALAESLAQERAQNRRLDDLDRASFRLAMRQHIRVFRAEHALHAPRTSAALQLPYKLRNLELAASHGVGVPTVLAVWPDIDAVQLDGLPDELVLKADGGAGSAAVFPLQRVGEGRYRLLGVDQVVDEDDLRERLRALGRRARAPYFAEELLHGPDGGPIPDDVKLYMFYGEVGHVLVRNVAVHGDPSTIRLKLVDELGQDYGEVALGRRHDPAIPVPTALPEMVTVAQHLSRAVGLPFCRVDLYETSRGIVLGEITRAPNGGNERFAETHDEHLGRLWVRAAARLGADLAAGRPAGPLFGAEAELRLYPAEGGPYAGDAERRVLPCSQWCERTHP